MRIKLARGPKAGTTPTRHEFIELLDKTTVPCEHPPALEIPEILHRLKTKLEQEDSPE